MNVIEQESSTEQAFRTFNPSSSKKKPLRAIRLLDTNECRCRGFFLLVRDVQSGSLSFDPLVSASLHNFAFAVVLAASIGGELPSAD